MSATTTETPDLFNEDVLDALSERGMALYREKIQPVVEPEQNGKHIAIHLDTGDYAVAANGPDAWRAMRARQPEGLIMTTIIGPDQMDQLAYRMLGSRAATRLL